MARSQRRGLVRWGAALALLGGCNGPSAEGGAASSAKPTRASAPASSVGSSAAPSAVTSAASLDVADANSATPVALAPIPAAEFCAKAQQIGDINYAKCAFSEQENSPALNYVKSIREATKECRARVESAQVEFHGEVAARCLAAAEKRGGRTTFFTFAEIPECEGVLTGKVAAGKPALFAEECATGLSFVKNRCVEPVAKFGDCDEYPGGILGKADNGERCQPGTLCFQTGFGADGMPLVFKCLPAQAEGAPCKLDDNQCTPGTSCYQGKCRARAAVGEACMRWGDCLDGHDCVIKGGVFGTCQKLPPAKRCGE